MWVAAFDTAAETSHQALPDGHQPGTQLNQLGSLGQWTHLVLLVSPKYLILY